PERAPARATSRGRGDVFTSETSSFLQRTRCFIAAYGRARCRARNSLPAIELRTRPNPGTPAALGRGESQTTRLGRTHARASIRTGGKLVMTSVFGWGPVFSRPQKQDRWASDLDQLIGSLVSGGVSGLTGQYAPATDVQETPEEFVIRLDL